MPLLDHDTLGNFRFFPNDDFEGWARRVFAMAVKLGLIDRPDADTHGEVFKDDAVMLAIRLAALHPPERSALRDWEARWRRAGADPGWGFESPESAHAGAAPRTPIGEDLDD